MSSSSPTDASSRSDGATRLPDADGATEPAADDFVELRDDATTATAKTGGRLSKWTQQLGTRVKSASTELSNRAQDARARLWTMAQPASASTEDGGLMVADSLEDALRELKRLVKEAKDKENPPPQTDAEQPPSPPKDPSKWDFPYTPLEDFQATTDDLLTAFCKWSTQDTEDEASGSTTSVSAAATEDGSNHASGGIVLDNRMDISKAFMRLESYADWMHANRTFFEGEPLTAISIAATARLLNFRLSHDVEGRMVWWMDLGRVDWTALRSSSLLSEGGDGAGTGRAVLRYVAWLAHACLLDASAQDNGLLVCEDANRLGLWTLLRGIPPQVQRKNHRLTWGVVPLKTKRVYVLRPGSGLNALLAAAKPFLSAKMRRRIVVLHDEAEIRAQVVQGVGGVEYVPVDCCGLHGTSSKELVFGKYIPEGAGVAVAESTPGGVTDDDL